MNTITIDAVNQSLKKQINRITNKRQTCNSIVGTGSV